MLSTGVHRPPSSPILCECDDATFWPWQTWEQIAAIPNKTAVLVVVPVTGYADHETGVPLDAEERVLMRVLREASSRCLAGRLLVLPPLRFVTGPSGVCAFSVEPPVAHDFIEEVCLSVAAAGFRRMVLLNSSPWNEELCDVAARDLRIGRGLQMFCVNLSALEVSFEGGTDAEFALAGGHLASLLEETAVRPVLPKQGRLENVQ